MQFRNFDPAQFVPSFRGVRLIGPSDGTFIQVERAEDTFTTHVGAAGDVTRVRQRNLTGSVTWTALAESPVNDVLSAIAREDELFGTGIGNFFLKDLNGLTVVEASTAWIRRVPNIEVADSAQGREWVFDCADLIMHVGGAVV